MRDLLIIIPIVFAASHAWSMLWGGFIYVSGKADDPLDENILKWMGYVFSPIGQIMFGILWDTSKI